ncbi:MAG TPA: hypothetical protein VGI17_09130 [Solirubrobacterales bacterium]
MVWFAPEYGPAWTGPRGETIGRVDAEGAVGEFSTPGLEDPVIGPSGELWASGSSTDAAGKGVVVIARISATGGTERAFAVGHGRRVESMVVAPDAIWFVRVPAGHRERIERLSTTDGGVRRFPLARYCETRGMALAPDGSLWFTEGCEGTGSRGGVSSIARIGAGGKIHRHRLPRGEFPESIAIGPAGTVWFGASNGGLQRSRIGRISPSGRRSEYRIRHGDPRSIAVDGEGRVWYPSTLRGSTVHGLGSIGPSGRPGRPICADPACDLAPSDLTTGPDGSLWYALGRFQKIFGPKGEGLAEQQAIEDEAGFIGHLVP